MSAITGILRRSAGVAAVLAAFAGADGSRAVESWPPLDARAEQTQPTLQTPTPSAPGTGAAAEEQVKQLVVMIRGKLGDADTIGAGIIASVTRDRIYVATANHVVRQGPQTTIASLEVLLKWLPGEWKPGLLLSNSDPELDLAVIAVPTTAGLGSPPRFAFGRVAAGVNRKDQAFTVGYPAGQAWMSRVTPDIVSEVTSDTVRFETSYLERGHSGGALVNANWEIVGLIKQDQPPVGVAIRAERVVERLRQWGYPVSLALTGSSRPTDSPKGPVAPNEEDKPPVNPTEARPPALLPLLNQAGWPMFGRDEFHTQWNRDETSLRPPLRMLRRTGSRGVTTVSLAAVDGRLLAARTNQSDNRTLVAGLDAATGRRQWTFDLAGIGSPGVMPTVAAGLVYAGGARRDLLYAVDSVTGKPHSQMKVMDLAARHPLVRDRVLYYQSPTELVALEPATRKVLWTYPVRSANGSPVFCGTLLVALAETGQEGSALLHVVSRAGDYVRSFPVPASPASHPIAAERSLGSARPKWTVFTSSGREVSAFWIVSERPEWTTTIPGESVATPTRLAYADGVVLAGIWRASRSGFGMLYAMDAESGKVLWRFSTGGEGAFGPIIANGVVYIAGSGNPRIFALDLKTGRELWSGAFAGPPTGDPIVAFGYLFVPVGSTIYVFGS